MPMSCSGPSITRAWKEPCRDPRDSPIRRFRRWFSVRNRPSGGICPNCCRTDGIVGSGRPTTGRNAWPSRGRRSTPTRHASAGGSSTRSSTWGRSRPTRTGFLHGDRSRATGPFTKPRTGLPPTTHEDPRPLPIAETRTSLRFGGRHLTVHHNQLLVWVSVHLSGVLEPETGIPRFPAPLDTGNNVDFSIQDRHLREWAGIDPHLLEPLGEM